MFSLCIFIFRRGVNIFIERIISGKRVIELVRKWCFIVCVIIVFWCNGYLKLNLIFNVFAFRICKEIVFMLEEGEFRELNEVGGKDFLWEILVEMVCI